MGRREAAIEIPEWQVGTTSSKLIAPDTVFRSIRNLSRTPDGSYRSVPQPVPLIPATAGGAPTGPSAAPSPNTPIAYGYCYGVHHARVKEGQRELILLHTEDTDLGNAGEIWEFQGWLSNWNCIIGPTARQPYVVAELATPAPDDFPTQWITTPNGVVIIPAGSRAYFYDGVVALPLGYDHAPGPPVGLGPDSTSSEWFPVAQVPLLGVNDSGYTMDGIENHAMSEMHPMFKMGRVGTVETPGNVSALAETGNETLKSQVMGYLKPGRYRGAYQWMDRWGNLSPLSPVSNDIRFRRQPAMALVDPVAPSVDYTLKWVHSDCALKEVAWTGIRPGPEGTIGRILYRTKDLENSGDPNLYELPRDASLNVNYFATLPDNASDTYPDNIPDAWLINRPLAVQLVPSFRLAEMAFGSLFMANARGQEGALWWSLPGRWGTVGAANVMYPDPQGAEITGLKKVEAGLLIFTENSTLLLTMTSQGVPDVKPLSTTTGCVAPSTIVTMRNGVTVWLASEGFYAYAAGQISYIFTDHIRRVTRFNRARIRKAVACFDQWTGEYRCWLSTEGQAKNGTCLCYDGVNWTHRLDFAAAGVTVTNDHRKLVIACGALPAGTEGPFVLDRNGDTTTAFLRTAWIRSTHSRERGSIRRARLWLRESGAAPTSSDKIEVSLSRDYRDETIATATVEPYPAVDTRVVDADAGIVNPDLWDTAVWDDATWRERRPFWASIDFDVPTCEVFRITITSTRRMEIVGLSFEEQPRDTSGAHGFR
jgi:hypothetical protein